MRRRKGRKISTSFVVEIITVHVFVWIWCKICGSFIHCLKLWDHFFVCQNERVKLFQIEKIKNSVWICCVFTLHTCIISCVFYAFLILKKIKMVKNYNISEMWSIFKKSILGEEKNQFYWMNWKWTYKNCERSRTCRGSRISSEGVRKNPFCFGEKIQVNWKILFTQTFF